MPRTGRPKTSLDTERTCPTCGSVFVRPDYDDKAFCSRECYWVSRRGRPSPLADQIDKICPVCGTGFSVPPSLNRVRCCSRTCSTEHARATHRGLVNEMTEAETAWLAGLLDGEGTVALAQRDRPGGGTLRLNIANTCLPLLEKVQAVTGCGTIVSHKRYKEHHLPGYSWQTYGEKARDLLRQMRPWLIVKAERADAAIAGEWFPKGSRNAGRPPRTTPTT